jgi:hypothetical protein
MSELTDRMRTCAAHILARAAKPDPWAGELVALDAADLLVEASNLLVEKQPEPEPDPEPEPEQLALEPFVFPQAPAGQAVPPIATWTAAGDTLPGSARTAPRSPRACPQCDSRTQKKVFRQGRTLMLACPVCAKEWPYG